MIALALYYIEEHLQSQDIPIACVDNILGRHKIEDYACAVDSLVVRPFIAFLPVPSLNLQRAARHNK